MLHVHRSPNFDACIEQNEDVLPSLGTFRPRHIGVGQLVYQADGRLALQDCIRVHLLEFPLPVFNDPARNLLDAFGQRERVRAIVRFEVPDDQAGALPDPHVRIEEHLVGLS